MNQRVGVVDYGTGNLRSVISAVNHVGWQADLVSTPEDLSMYSKLLLPGVGSFGRAMEQIREKGFDVALSECVINDKVPVLGICLGMQLLCQNSCEDGITNGLGFIQCQVERFSFSREKHETLKIPHVGFNTVDVSPESRLFAGLGDHADFYFTHSYRIQHIQSNAITSSCWHGENFIAAIEQKHIAATQFHPEKSQANGLLLLRNFLERF